MQCATQHVQHSNAQEHAHSAFTNASTSGVITGHNQAGPNAGVRLFVAALAHEQLWSSIGKGAAGRRASCQVASVHDARQAHIRCAAPRRTTIENTQCLKLYKVHKKL